jgi:hypothetical protein
MMQGKEMEGSEMEGMWEHISEDKKKASSRPNWILR